MDGCGIVVLLEHILFLEKLGKKGRKGKRVEGKSYGWMGGEPGKREGCKIAKGKMARA